MENEMNVIENETVEVEAACNEECVERSEKLYTRKSVLTGFAAGIAAGIGSVFAFMGLKKAHKKYKAAKEEAENLADEICDSEG